MLRWLQAPRIRAVTRDRVFPAHTHQALATTLRPVPEGVLDTNKAGQHRSAC